MHSVSVGDDAKNVLVQGILQNVPARANHGSEMGKLSSSAADGRRTESHGSARLVAGKAILSRASQDPVSQFSPSNPARVTSWTATTNLFISAAFAVKLSRRQRLATLSNAAFLRWGRVEVPGALGESSAGFWGADGELSPLSQPMMSFARPVRRWVLRVQAS